MLKGFVNVLYWLVALIAAFESSLLTAQLIGWIISLHLDFWNVLIGAVIFAALAGFLSAIKDYFNENF